MINSAYSEDRTRSDNGYLTSELLPKEQRPGEFDFFVRMAAKSGGPVLELASGAGRILMTLAESGFEAFGLEASEPMLDLCKRAMAQLPVDAQKRIHLVRGDMRQFAFARRFPLIIIPFHSFWYNFTRVGSFEEAYNIGGAAHGNHGNYKAGVYGQAEGCLRSIAEALASSGTFIIDTPYMFFESAWWDAMAQKHGFSYRIENPYMDWAKDTEALIGEKGDG